MFFLMNSMLFFYYALIRMAIDGDDKARTLQAKVELKTVQSNYQASLCRRHS